MAELRKTVFDTRAGSTLTLHESEGAGPPLFAIGGLSVRPLADSGLYRAFREAAGEGARCVMVEIAGSGDSPATPGMTMDTWIADVEEVFEARVREPAICTGASMGGWLMLIVHRRHPSWFRAMCAIAPALDWDQAYLGPGLVARRLAMAGDLVVDEGGAGVAGKNAVTRALVVSMAPHHVVRAGPFALQVPLHVIFGARDEMAPAETTRRFIELARGAPCTGELLVEGDHSLAKLDWEAGLERYREWLRVQRGAPPAASEPPRAPADPRSAR
jgi:pimeloyl-ACP methyl ester carboxylesterase